MREILKAEAKTLRLSLIILSFIVVALAQPDWSIAASILVSCCGYAIFWKGALNFSKKKHRFWLATTWFAIIQAFHLSWLTSDRYVGPVIFLVLAMIIFGLGLQFGLITLFLKPSSKLSHSRILGIAGLWILMEWSRLFLLTGFAWNPVGLTLSSTLYGMQLASIVGVFGLSFCVMLTNLFAFKMFSIPFHASRFGTWAIFAIFPYIFGYVQVQTHQKEMAKGNHDHLSVALVQTSLYPEQKVAFAIEGQDALDPYEQWERILSMLAPYKDQNLDLIVFSESVVPYGTDYPIYSLQDIHQVYREIFNDVSALPPSQSEQAGNSYWAQALANYLNADVVIGLDDAEENKENDEFKVYNAAFLFRPFDTERVRYEKRVLVPMGEYIPFQWCRSILAKYGITESMTPGKTAKSFSGSRITFGVSICYEEIYGNLMRENRLKDVNLLVNLTNDVWYPKSRLPLVHFYHGKLRSVETGLPIVRACNTGVTCGLDCLGRVIGMFPFESSSSDAEAGVLHLSVPLYNFPTIYSIYGDSLMIGCSLLFLLLLSLNEWVPFSLFQRKRSVLETVSDEKLL